MIFMCEENQLCGGDKHNDNREERTDHYSER